MEWCRVTGYHQTEFEFMSLSCCCLSRVFRILLLMSKPAKALLNRMYQKYMQHRKRSNTNFREVWAAGSLGSYQILRENKTKILPATPGRLSTLSENSKKRYSCIVHKSQHSYKFTGEKMRARTWWDCDLQTVLFCKRGYATVL